VRTARDTVGPDIELMVDAGGSDAYWPHGYKWALKTAQMLANYDITWFEEALRPDDFAGFAELRKHSPVPIATGEVLTRRQSFMPLLQQQAVDIVQPDCTKCGGLTEAWRIAWMAHENYVQWVPHGWNTAVGLAADIQLSCAMPVARYVEFLTPSPYMDDLIKVPFRPDAEGYLTLPDAPGLGIELNPESMARFRAG
jgi:L-alanine-DL-glutamate epimerase-like enolase superfamily enzyme